MDIERAKEKLTRDMGARDIRVCDNPETAVKVILAIYSRAVRAIQEAITAATDLSATMVLSSQGGFYPFIAFAVPKEMTTARFFEEKISSTAAYGFFRNGPGLYYSTVTRPDIFGDYLLEQLKLVMDTYKIPVLVGISAVEIPVDFAPLESPCPPSVRESLKTPDLNEIGAPESDKEGINPLAVFTALRTDYALQRLRHYTGTDPAKCQRIVLLTNYDMYVKAFVEWAKEAVAKGNGYKELILPRGYETEERLPQMPAFHIVREDGNGITLINIGVGPTNALNIALNLAVLRPHAVLMVGHCGGLRQNQRLGGFVLGEAYFRDDHVANSYVPPGIPIPPIAELNSILRRATEQVKGITEHPRLKDFLQSGTVATTGDRNWELNELLRHAITQSRALAVDMESATIAAMGLHLMVPFGTFLCISDLPLLGKPKLPGMADDFYKQNVQDHLLIAVRACELIREENPSRLHSRKLREVYGPVFR